MGKYDSRLFNKMRTEFYRWSIVVANSFQKGESKAPWETLQVKLSPGPGGWVMQLVKDAQSKELVA